MLHNMYLELDHQLSNLSLLLSTKQQNNPQRQTDCRQIKAKNRIFKKSRTPAGCLCEMTMFNMHTTKLAG